MSMNGHLGDEAGAISNAASPKPQRKRSERRVPAGGISAFPVEVKRGGRIHRYWRATQQIEINGDPIRKVAQARTQQEAIASVTQKLLEIRVAYGQVGAEVLTPAPRLHAVTIDELLAVWLRKKKKIEKPATYRAYDSRVRLHIEPVFGDRPIRLITAAEMETFFDVTLPASGLGNESIRQIYRVLKGVFDEAQYKHIITSHPMADVKQPKNTVKTDEDRKRVRQVAYLLEKYLIKYAQEADADPQVTGTYHTARWLCGMLGLRQSEVLGLTDADLEKGRRLVVRHQLTRISPEHGCGPWSRATRSYPCGRTNRGCASPKTPGAWQLTTTKSAASMRSLILPPHIYKVLDAQRRRQQAFRKTAAFAPEPGEGIDLLLFTKPDGKPLYGQADREALYELLSQIKTLPPDVTVHTLRHAATTLLITEGAGRENVIATLGWNPKNADAQLATYNSTDAAKLAEVDVAKLTDRFYPAPPPPVRTTRLRVRKPSVASQSDALPGGAAAD